MPDVRVRDGDILEGDGFTIECVFTPGHTSNHMCYALKEEKALFTGDHVMGWSTTVVTPPDGDMASLSREPAESCSRATTASSGRRMAVRCAIPGHSCRPISITAPSARRRFSPACAKACQRIPDMVARMYADVDKRLHPAAARSVLAHLIELEDEGRVARDGDAYRMSR